MSSDSSVGAMYVRFCTRKYMLDSRCEEGVWGNVHQKTDLVLVKGKFPRELKHRNN